MEKITSVSIATSNGLMTFGDLSGSIVGYYDPETKKCLDAENKEIVCPREVGQYTQDKTLGWMIAVIALIVVLAVVLGFYFNK